MTTSRPDRAAPFVLVAMLVAALPVAAAPAGEPSVSVVEIALIDNGDGDGFADTRETVAVDIRIVNTGTVDLTGLTAVLATDETEHVCVTDGAVSIGALAAGAEVVVPAAFEFHVLDGADRATLGLGPYDPLSTAFRITFDSEQGTFPAQPREFAVDLDLDVSGGSGPTAFFESFEESLGAFEIENLDANLTTYESVDGYRCQYNDPDNPDGYGDLSGNCYLGANPAHAADEFWGLSGPAFSPLGGRGFSGFHSLFFGRDLGPDANWTTPLGVLEAVRTTDPIHLAHDTRPVLSIKHQASMVDSRLINSPPGETSDRAVVMIQVADDAGNPSGPWIKVFAMRNDYDSPMTRAFLNCSFDPIDDGSSEDDRTPGDGSWGPSSTCWPESVYSFIGETSNPFGAANTGLADGPGLQGLWGIGTWIESSFDLDRFRGRSVRIRFLATAIKGSDSEETWEDRYLWNPTAGDDGWWIDDVTIEQALSVPATVSNDVNDNSGLPAPSTVDTDADGVADVCDNCPGQPNSPQLDFDYDGHGDVCDLCPEQADDPDVDADLVCDTADNCPAVANPDQTDADADGFGAACDCFDADATMYPGADENNDGLDDDCDGLTDELPPTAGFFAGDGATFSWDAQAGAIRYQVVRGDAPDFSGTCETFTAFSPAFSDATVPPAGTTWHYLVRSFGPFTGSFGSGAGGERSVPCAP